MGTEISNIDIHRDGVRNEIDFNLCAHGHGGGFRGSEKDASNTASEIVRLLKECKKINPDETIELTSTRDLQHTLMRAKREQLTEEELTQILGELQKNRTILGMNIRFEIGAFLTRK